MCVVVFHAAIDVVVVVDVVAAAVDLISTMDALSHRGSSQRRLCTD